ncbi:mitogen-activated protein kinase 1 [Helicobacter phage SwA626G]|nr:mitogen-activated protein kinase 1 [Helicobacter phage SwA626G]
MKLYNKIQELINESETLKQKNNEVLGLARNELSELVNIKANENLESLKNTFQGYLNGKLVEMPLIIKKNVKDLVDNEALSVEVRNELLSQFDKQAITNALRQEIKNEIKSELDNLLSDSELQSELKQAKNEIVTETTSESITALTSKILGILESQLNAITESVIKNLDFSFLSAQPKAFYSVINENLKEMFLKELESEFLKNFIKEAIDNALKEAEKLKALKIAELKALCYLQVTLESHKVQLLQNALMIEAEILNNKMKIENEIAYNLKRKELIADGKLEDESFKKYIFKVI